MVSFTNTNLMHEHEQFIRNRVEIRYIVLYLPRYFSVVIYRFFILNIVVGLKLIVLAFLEVIAKYLIKRLTQI